MIFTFYGLHPAPRLLPGVGGGRCRTVVTTLGPTSHKPVLPSRGMEKCTCRFIMSSFSRLWKQRWKRMMAAELDVLDDF